MPYKLKEHSVHLHADIVKTQKQALTSLTEANLSAIYLYKDG